MARGDSIKGWVYIRKNILDRDQYRCRICHNETGKLHVHHIDYNRSHNNEKNLVTLCDECHRLVHLEGYKPSDHEDWPPPWGEHFYE